MKKAYGGVVIDLGGQVLLREPVERRRRVGWTFAKGKPEPGETPEQTALREVLEETGIEAKILAKVPGSFAGTRTQNRYFLMLPLEDTKRYDEETLAVKWVDVERAAELISRTRKANRRARDLQVLQAAFELFRSLCPMACQQSMSCFRKCGDPA